ncbi:helix-turn-helix domain-containing protein [Nocardia sp. NPDC006044]|uniref:helix-turn-helix domain-containing protein n=1 Tax=Nocardia sp. NPDC006044 TaxID=3364306 RepID=UPI0036AB0178
MDVTERASCETWRVSRLGEFLRAKRASIAPEQVGLAPVGNPRRVSGLRREEVAQLAALSVDQYTWLELGRVTRVSDDALCRIARALLLTEDEQAYLRLLMLPHNRIAGEADTKKGGVFGG